jgi:hypothetical protein
MTTKKILIILRLLTLFMIYLFFLLVVIFLPYPSIDRDSNESNGNGYILFTFVLLTIYLGYAFGAVKRKFITDKSQKYITFLMPVFLYLIAILSPLYLVYFTNVENLRIRANQRASEGNWNQAIDIYCFIKPRIEEPNKHISRIQRWLKEVGYYHNEINGIADRTIIKSLKDFQKSNNLEPDGYIGEKTQFVLFNKLFKNKLDSIKYNNDVEGIKNEVNMLISEYNLTNFDNTKGILYGIMFRESLNLKDNELTVANLREAVKKLDKNVYQVNGRFNDEILNHLLMEE